MYILAQSHNFSFDKVVPFFQLLDLLLSNYQFQYEVGNQIHLIVPKIESVMLNYYFIFLNNTLYLHMLFQSSCLLLTHLFNFEF